MRLQPLGHPSIRALDPTSGEGGIRTLEGLLGPNALAGRRLKPLGHLSKAPGPTPQAPRRFLSFRADDRARTGDPQLGKLMLYQLSYARIRLSKSHLPESNRRPRHYE